MKKLVTKLLVAFGLLTSGGVSATAQSSETIFSLEVKSGVKLSLAAKTSAKIDETYATIENGSALIYNGHKSNPADVIDGGQVNLGGSGSSYCKITLTGNTLQEGDVISLGSSGTWKIGSTEKTATSQTTPYTVQAGDGLVGSKVIYIKKDGKKVFKTFTVLRPGADYVSAPAISVSGATVTLTCDTEGTKIFYTTDGIEPTSASTKYSSAITLTESATVRAIAIKGEQKSEETSKDVYVAGKGALATLGSKGGALNEVKNVWTSTDGKFTLTDKTADRTIDAVTLSASNDGFKLNHNDEYVLQPAADIKVTKIVVVGKTWNSGKAGNASSISITGFTPESGTFYDYLSGGSTGVKTLTFTADETVGYGTAITLKISNNQLGAYIEVYGEETATTYDNGWVSFTPSFDCAVTTEGAAAYIATNVAGSNVTMTKVEKMKAGNGYFLYAGSSEVKDLTVEIAEGATAPAENLIKGCTAATKVDGATSSIYCLGKLNGKAGLYKVSTSLDVPAGKAYLQAPLALKASVLNLVFSDSSETTAVKGISTQAEKNEAAIGTKHIINGQIVIKTQNGYMNLMGVQVK